MLLPCQFDIAPHTPGYVSRLAQNVRGGKGNVPKCHEITFVIVFPSENCWAINQLDFFLFHYRNGGRQCCVRNFAVRRSRSGFQSGNKKSQLYSLKLPVSSVIMGQNPEVSLKYYIADISHHVSQISFECFVSKD